MNGWLVAYLALHALGLGVHLAKHGQKREDSYNFTTAAIASALSLGLLYMAGAFSL